MGQRVVGEGNSGFINFVGYGIGQRLSMAWSLIINCRVPLAFHFTVTTSLPEPKPATESVKEPSAP